MIDALCADCGKTWRVPSAERSYRCKECGGRVAATAAPTEAALPSTDPRESAAAVPVAPVAPPLPPARPAATPGDRAGAPSRRGRSGRVATAPAAQVFLASGDPAARSAAEDDERTRALSRYGRLTLTARIFCWIGVGLSTLLLLLIILIGLGGAGGGLISAALLFSAGFYAFCAMKAHAHPGAVGIGLLGLPISSIAAFLLIRLLGLPTLWDFGGELGRQIPALILFGILLPFMLKAAKLQMRWPDLGSRRTARIDLSEDQFDAMRPKLKRQAAAMRNGLLIAGFATQFIILLGAGAVTSVPSPAATADRFAEAWPHEKLDTLMSYFQAEDSRRLRAAIEDELTKRDWSAQRPPLTERSIANREPNDRVAIVTWRVQGGQLRAEFAFAGKTWRIVDLQFPELSAPPLRPKAAEFAGAWSTGDAPAIMAYLDGGPESRLGKSLLRALERREWMEQRPKIYLSELNDREPGTADVSYLLENQVLQTRWTVVRGVWMIERVRFPKDE